MKCKVLRSVTAFALHLEIRVEDGNCRQLADDGGRVLLIGVAADGHRVGSVRADRELGEESGTGAVMLQCPVGISADR